MKNIELVDRDSEQIEDIDSSVTRGVKRVIKLTETTIEMSDSIYNKFLNQDNEETKKYSESNEIIQKDNDMSGFTLTSVGVSSIEETRYAKSSSKAIKESDAMIGNTDMKYSGVLSKNEFEDIDVNKVNTEEITNTVESSFDFYNINQDESDYETDDLNETDENYEESTLDNLVNSYEEEQSVVEEPELEDSSDYLAVEENIIPEIKEYFSNHDVDGTISNVQTEMDDNYETNDDSENKTQDLFDEIASSIDDENITIGDLNELSQKLNQVFSKNKQLTNANEELSRERDAAVDELNGVMEQQQEAERRKAAIIEEYNSMVSDLQHENEELEETTNRVQEEINEVKARTKEIKSNVTATEKYSSDIIDMLSDYGYGTANESISEVKAKAA